MKIDALGIQAFIAIAEQQGFQKAADALHISQTALTRRLQNLESSLRVKLVERTTRSVALTIVGSRFLPQAQRLLGELTASMLEIRETSSAHRGDVCIACIPTAAACFLPRILREYGVAYPDNRVRIVDKTSAAVTEAVLRRGAEFGINVKESHHGDLDSEALFDDRFVLICRHDHALANQKRVTWRQLHAHALIITGEATVNRALLERAVGASARGLAAFYEVQRSTTAIGLVGEGVAAAVVPALVMRNAKYPGIRVIALTAPVVSRSLVLITRKNVVLSPAARALYRLVQDARGGASRRQASPTRSPSKSSGV